MLLSPFKARLAVGLFLCVGMAVGANLLYFQSTVGAGSRNGIFGTHAASSMDSERLERLALEALGRAATPAPPRVQPAALSSDGVLEPASVGRFAPLSTGMMQAAMPSADPEEARQATVRAVQAELARRGYAPGPIDGAVGLVTRAAVLAYEHDQGLPLTADPSPEVLAHLRHGTSAPGVAIGLDGTPKAPAGHADKVMRAVERGLQQLGYLSRGHHAPGSEELVRAIREFEMDGGLVPSGRISAPMVAKLGKQLNGKLGG